MTLIPIDRKLPRIMQARLPMSFPLGRRGVTLLCVLVLSTFASLGFLAVRRVMSGHFAYRFLPWNLFLAWIPFWLAMGLCFVHRAAPPRYGRMWSLGLLWLLFFPNSPYIITDFVHLTPTRSGAYWCDLVLVMAFAWNGLLLGFVSLYLVQRVVRERAGPAWGWLATVAAMGLGSFGIALGRLQRWNSWDIFLDPLNLVWDIGRHLVHPFGHARAFALAAMFFVFLFVAYLALLAIMYLGREENELPAPAFPGPGSPADKPWVDHSRPAATLDGARG